MSDVGLVISEIEPYGKGFKVELTGSISLYSAGQLNTAVLKKTTPGMRLALDLTKVPMVDSSGIGFIIRLARDLDKKKGRLILCGVNRDFKQNLEMLKVDTLVQMAANLSAIPESFWS